MLQENSFSRAINQVHCSNNCGYYLSLVAMTMAVLEQPFQRTAASQTGTE